MFQYILYLNAKKKKTTTTLSTTNGTESKALEIHAKMWLQI